MIAVTAALKAEIAPLTGRLKETTIIKKLGRKFHQGKIGGKDVVTAVVGHGKVDTAGSTQLLISEFSPKTLIHIGSAGGLSPNIAIGEFVLGTTIVEHDYHCKFGRVTPPPEYFTTSSLNQAMLTSSLGSRLNPGIIVSGNEDVIEVERRDELYRKFKGLSVDWESAASTRICAVNSVSTSVIRVVVDGAHQETDSEFKMNLDALSVDLCNWVHDFLSEIDEK